MTKEVMQQALEALEKQQYEWTDCMEATRGG